MKSRFTRLLYPYIFWSIFLFFLHNILIKFTSNIYYKKKLTLIDLFQQLILGANYHQLFWFLFNLIFISLFLTIISFIAKQYLLVILEFLSIISLYLHFSGINYNFFISFNSIIGRSVGSLITFFPLSVSGCILSSINIILKLKNIILPLKIILFSLIYLFFEFNLFIWYPGFMYPNVIANIQISTIFLLAFGALNLENSKILKGILKYITRNTGGIYYIHLIVMNFIFFYIDKKRTYFSAFLNYIICYIICFFGNKIARNSDFIYLFK